MRFLIALGGLLCAGCVGPHSTGALWAQQNIQREIELSRVSDATRAQQAQAYQQASAERLLATERARVTDLVSACPGSARVPIGISPGDRSRDALRVLAYGDARLEAMLTQLAQADWFARRGQSSGDAAQCDRARQALNGAASASDPTASAAAHAVLDALGKATVARDPTAQPVPESPRVRTIGDPAELPTTTISAYALNFSDTVTAPSPLPQYLAAVYGGALVGSAPQPNLRGRTPESVVDEIAPAIPDWEPDALYAALSSQ